MLTVVFGFVWTIEHIPLVGTVVGGRLVARGVLTCARALCSQDDFLASHLLYGELEHTRQPGQIPFSSSLRGIRRSDKSLSLWPTVTGQMTHST